MIDRKAAAIVIIYSASVISLSIFLSGYGYTALVFYSSVFWIVLPLLIYAKIRNLIERRRNS
ncbi:MAG: hypothetical protein M1117_02535 [Candidatus Thermoplasmatota archaeon]|nr:hypothetical protein [Candidatus Thermoplasmatota archaeon]